MFSDIRRCLDSQENYPQTKKFRNMIIDDDKATIKSVQNAIVSLIKDSKTRPLTKLLAVKFAKDCIETFNEDIIYQMQFSVLPVFEMIATFKSNVQDPNRGSHIFSIQPNNQQAKEGTSFLIIVLECIRVWSKWFPIDPETEKFSSYKVCYQRLVLQGVMFPSSNYFSVTMIKKHLPEKIVPRAMLKECNDIIRYNKNNPSITTKSIVDKLRTTLNQCMKSNQKDVFYEDIIHRIVKNMIRNHRYAKQQKQNLQQSQNNQHQINIQATYRNNNTQLNNIYQLPLQYSNTNLQRSNSQQQSIQINQQLQSSIPQQYQNTPLLRSNSLQQSIQINKSLQSSIPQQRLNTPLLRSNSQQQSLQSTQQLQSSITQQYLKNSNPLKYSIQQNISPLIRSESQEKSLQINIQQIPSSIPQQYMNSLFQQSKPLQYSIQSNHSPLLRSDSQKTSSRLNNQNSPSISQQYFNNPLLKRESQQNSITNQSTLVSTQVSSQQLINPPIPLLRSNSGHQQISNKQPIGQRLVQSGNYKNQIINNALSSRQYQNVNNLQY